MYQNLEARVAEKTAELEEKRERLETLYSVTTLVANAVSLDELARGFTERVPAWPMPMARPCAGPTRATSAT
jgi:two-component system nitrate/nitrite sensor histidine kinase NarX